MRTMRARGYLNLLERRCQVKRRSMSRHESRTVYKKASDRIHKRNLVSAVNQRGGGRL